MKRRDFTRNAFVVSALAPLMASGANASPQGRALKKGIMWGSIGFGKTIMEKFQAAKAAGFDGVEVMSPQNREETLAAMKETGMPVASVCGNLHWKYLLSDADANIRKQGVEALKAALEDAKLYGTDTVLLVPGRVTESVSYDECWTRSAEEIKKVIPVAEKLRVKIAIENVWNSFLMSPLEAVRYVDQFKSKYVGFYFDCGNILAFGWPEQWIRILGKRIARVHIKEYSRKIADKEGRSAGFRASLTEGDVNWAAVMKALDETGYTGWTTIEQPGGGTPEGLKDLCDRLIRIHNT